MRFDWQAFCDEYGINYVTTGSNVARGNINIECPFCRSDPSQHMGLHLHSSQWACWRDETHRGASPVRLISALLKCGRTEAAEIAMGAGVVKTEAVGSLKQRVSKLGHTETKKKRTKLEAVEYPDNFRKIRNKGVGKLFFRYLRHRGIGKDTAKAADTFGLRYCVSGQWAYRIIMPLTVPSGERIGWMGRSVSTSAGMRYLAYPEGRQPKCGLFAADYAASVRRLDLLIVCEGPFDALKVNRYAACNVAAVSVQTTSATSEQLGHLRALASRAGACAVLFDRGAYTASVRLCGDLVGCRARPVPLEVVDDPAELDGRAILGMTRTLLSQCR